MNDGEARTIEDILETEGVFVSTTVGTSMYPMLRNRRDVIVIGKRNGRLKKYDVPLYKTGNRYTLHRVIDVLPDSYVIRGDNCDRKEYGVTDDQIVGVLTGFYRGDRPVNMEGAGYKAYVRAQHALYPLQWICRRAVRVWGKVRRLFSKGREI